MKNKIKTILNDKHLGEILRGSGIVFVFRVIASIVAFLLTVIIVKQLGAEQSGYYFFILSFLMFLGSFSSFGLFNAVLKEVSINRTNKIYISNVMTRSITLILIGSLTTIILLYLYNYLSIQFNVVNPIIDKYFEIIILSIFPFTLTFLFSNYFQARKNLILSMILLNLGYQLIILLLLTIYTISTAKELLIIFDISIFIIIICSFYIYFIHHKHKILYTDDKSFCNLLTLSIPMMITHIVSQVNNFSGQLLLSIYATPTDISLFAVSMRIAILMSFFVMAINKIVAPKFAILYKEGNLHKLEEIVLFSNKLLLLFSLPMLIVIVFLGKEILSVFGAEFKDAYYILVIVAVGQFIASLSGTVIFLLQMTGHEKIIRNNIIIVTLISLLIGIIIVPIYGIFGVAIMTFISLVTVNLLSCYKAYTLLGINPLKFFSIGAIKK